MGENRPQPTATGIGAELWVSDTGVGIPENEQPRLFERFHRVEGQRSRSHEGSGIGLALVYDLVKLHGGSIRVRSEVGRGTEFVVAVPSGTAHLPAGHVGEAQPASVPTLVRADAYVEEALRWLPDVSPPLASEPGPATDRGARVLLVDDNADMRDYVRRLLGRSYEVETAADGAAALASLRARKPDLMLSDVMMPGLDGVGLLRAIRADPGLRELPVILLSARAGDEAKAEGLDAGADDYLAKPFSARELLARVGANVAMARVRREAAGALQESEARFRTMADNAPALIYVVDAQGQVTFANRHYEALFGRPADDVLGDGWRRIVHPEDVEPFHAAFLAAFAQRRPFRAEVRVVDAAGALRWLRCEAVPRLEPGGEFQGYVGCNVDVTEAKVAEAALREREAELARVQRIGGVGGL